MQYNATEQLHIVMHHVPLGVVATSHPMVLVNGLVALNGYKVVTCGKFAVKVIGCHLDGLVFSKAACGILYNGKHFGQRVVEGNLHAVEHLGFELVNLAENYFAVFNWSFLHFAFQLFNLLLDVIGRVLNSVLQFFGFGTQRVIVESLNSGIGRFDFLHPRLNEFHVACRLVTE